MTKPSLTVVLLAAALLLLGGCGNDTDSTAGGGSSSSAATSSSAASSSSSSATSSTSSASPSGPAPCRTSGLKITLGPGEGAAGSTFFPLLMKNVSTKPCRTGGFGGVSLVTGPQGQTIGAPADRSQQSQVRPIKLSPGQIATATLQVTNAENFPASKCQPKQAAGFRVRATLPVEEFEDAR